MRAPAFSPGLDEVVLLVCGVLRADARPPQNSGARVTLRPSSAGLNGI